MATTPYFQAKEQMRWALVAKQFARLSLYGEHRAGPTAAIPSPLPVAEEKVTVRRINREELVSPPGQEAQVEPAPVPARPTEQGKEVPEKARPQGLFTVDPRTVTASHFFTQLKWERRSLDAELTLNSLEEKAPARVPPAQAEANARLILSSQVPWSGRGLAPAPPTVQNTYQDAELVTNRSSFSQAATASALSSAKKIASRAKGSRDPYSPLPEELSGDCAGAFFRNLNWNTPQQRN